MRPLALDGQVLRALTDKDHVTRAPPEGRLLCSPVFAEKGLEPREAPSEAPLAPGPRTRPSARARGLEAEGRASPGHTQEVRGPHLVSLHPPSQPLREATGRPLPCPRGQGQRRRGVK